MTTTTTKRPDHFRVFEGDLYHDNNPDVPLRTRFEWLHRDIRTTSQLKSTLRVPYAWPGGYETVFFTSDGVLLCRGCVLKHLRSVLSSVKDRSGDGWRVIGAGIEATSADSLRDDPELEELISRCDQCEREFGELA